jgi:norsolorinic acid ketoreductase
MMLGIKPLGAPPNVSYRSLDQGILSIQEMAPVNVLITGANRGIGKGILELYLKKPNHTVIAANRDPSHPTSKSLNDLPKAEGSSLHVVKIDANSPTDPADAVKELLTIKGIDHIDILIANAGMALGWPTVEEVKVDYIQKHVDVNIYGFIRLYQAFLPLLKMAQDPKWVTIGSSAAFLKVGVNLSL